MRKWISKTNFSVEMSLQAAKYHKTTRKSYLQSKLNPVDAQEILAIFNCYGFVWLFEILQKFDQGEIESWFYDWTC